MATRPAGPPLPYNCCLPEPYNCCLPEPYNCGLPEPYNCCLSEPYKCGLSEPSKSYTLNTGLSQPWTGPSTSATASGRICVSESLVCWRALHCQWMSIKSGMPRLPRLPRPPRGCVDWMPRRMRGDHRCFICIRNRLDRTRASARALCRTRASPLLSCFSLVCRLHVRCGTRNAPPTKHHDGPPVVQQGASGIDGSSASPW